MTEGKMQSLKDLEAEMHAVARGEKRAPADAAQASFQSIEAPNRPSPLPERHRPSMAAGTLDHWGQIFHRVGWFIPPYVTAPDICDYRMP